MRSLILRATFLVVAAAGVSSWVAGCSDEFKSCEESNSCDAPIPYCNGRWYGKRTGELCEHCPILDGEVWRCDPPNDNYCNAEGGTVWDPGPNRDYACPAPDGSEGTGGTSGGGGNGGEGGIPGQGGAGGAIVGCDDELGPDEDACVVNDAFGVFVSPDGDDDDPGTQGAPFATVGRAIEAAAEDGKRVYVCATAGDYEETLRLTSDTAGLEIYGGFDCENWEYSTENKARIAPSNIEGASQAVIAENAGELKLYDLEIVADDAGEPDEPGESGEPGKSSIALTLLSTDAVLTRVVLTAGNGAAGTDGSLTEFRYPDIDDLAGCDADDNHGDCEGVSGACTHTCEGDDEVTKGGTRGAPENGGGDGAPGDTTNGGDEPDTTCDNGKRGDSGASGDDGGGAQSYGTLNNEGWTPANGNEGSPGHVGQGGGGGSGGPSSGVGGGGGCGGCGGNGATPGTGGGSSIALLSYDSALTLTECTLTAAKGGNGGNGTNGQAGQRNDDPSDRAGRAGIQSGDGCPGGPGGVGGDGGASGGGAGGLSVGILYDSGNEPTLDEATEAAIAVSEAAASGGAAVDGHDDTAGEDGVAEATLGV